MARTAAETASILTELYDETFKNETCEQFRISWAQLRSIAGVARLDNHYLRRINSELNETEYFLMPMDSFLLVTKESDLNYVRTVPDRVAEQHLYDIAEDEDIELDDEDVDDLEVPDDEETVVFGT